MSPLHARAWLKIEKEQFSIYILWFEMVNKQTKPNVQLNKTLRKILFSKCKTKPFPLLLG